MMGNKRDSPSKKGQDHMDGQHSNMKRAFTNSDPQERESKSPDIGDLIEALLSETPEPHTHAAPTVIDRLMAHGNPAGERVTCTSYKNDLEGLGLTALEVDVATCVHVLEKATAGKIVENVPEEHWKEGQRPQQKGKIVENTCQDLLSHGILRQAGTVEDRSRTRTQYRLRRSAEFIFYEDSTGNESDESSSSLQRPAPARLAESNFRSVSPMSDPGDVSISRPQMAHRSFASSSPTRRTRARGIVRRVASLFID